MLDEFQQAVVDHPGGPLLVLAGPGTGKTTTLVEAVVDRIEHRGASPESVLALTFSRKAAEQLRDRVTARLGRTTSTHDVLDVPLLRLRPDPALLAARAVRRPAPAAQRPGAGRRAPRAAEPTTPSRCSGPTRCGAALGTRGFAREVHAVLGRAREKGLDGDALRALGGRTTCPEYVAAGLFLEQYLRQPRPAELDRLHRPDPAGRHRGRPHHRDELRAQFAHVFVDEYQDTDPAQVRAAPRARRRRSRPHRRRRPAPVDLRLPRGRGPRHPRFPARVRPPRRRTCRRSGALRTTRRFGPRLLHGDAARRRTARRSPAPIDAAARDAFLSPARRRVLGRRPGRGARPYETERAEAEHLADLLRRAHLEDGIEWAEMAVLVRSGRTSIPGLRRGTRRRRRPGRGRRRRRPLVRDPPCCRCSTRCGPCSTSTTTIPRPRRVRRPGRAEALLMGPLGGLDASDVRRLGRALRDQGEQLTHEEGRPPRPSRELLRAGSGAEDGDSSTAHRAAAERARALHTLLAWARRARLGRHRRAGAVDALVRHVLAPAPASRRDGWGCAARRANRDLDSLVALFDAAARAEEQRDHLGVATSWPPSWPRRSRPTRSPERGQSRGAAVRLLTAHRSKGLEWRLVVVAHVQAEALARPPPTLDPAAGRPHRQRRSPFLPSAPGSCCSRSADCSTSRAPVPGSAWS